MSRTLSTKYGSVESLNPSVRRGARAKARQMREMVVWLSPKWAASVRVDQWVAFSGMVSRGVVIPSWTWSSRIVQGAPERGAIVEAGNAMLGKAPTPLGHRHQAQIHGLGKPTTSNR
jgi:hypothetical protein